MYCSAVDLKRPQGPDHVHSRMATGVISTVNSIGRNYVSLRMEYARAKGCRTLQWYLVWLRQDKRKRIELERILSGGSNAI